MLDIDLLRRRGEDQMLEFKASFSDQDGIIDTLVAFANSQGGDVIVGVSPKPGHPLVGADIGPNTLELLAVRLRSRAGPLPGFRSETIAHQGHILARFSVVEHLPGQLLLSAGVAWIRVSNTNLRMTAEQVRNRILEDPELTVGRPRFQVTGGSSTNPKDSPYMTLERAIEQVEGEFLESIEVRYVGPLVNPPMEWQRSRVERHAGRSTARITHQFRKDSPTQEGSEVPNGHLAIDLRFRWRGTSWYQRHLFPFAGWNPGREILPSKMRREDTDWIPAS